MNEVHFVSITFASSKWKMPKNSDNSISLTTLVILDSKYKKFNEWLNIGLCDSSRMGLSCRLFHVNQVLWTVMTKLFYSGSAE